MAKKKTRRAKKLHLRLVVDVTYLPQGVPEEELREMLGGIVTHAMGEGLVTLDTEAEVDTYSFRVETVPEGQAEVRSIERTPTVGRGQGSYSP